MTAINYSDTSSQFFFLKKEKDIRHFHPNQSNIFPFLEFVAILKKSSRTIRDWGFIINLHAFRFNEEKISRKCNSLRRLKQKWFDLFFSFHIRKEELGVRDRSDAPWLRVCVTVVYQKNLPFALQLRCGFKVAGWLAKSWSECSCAKLASNPLGDEYFFFRYMLF